MVILLTYATLALLCDQFSKRAVHTRLASPLPCGRFLRLREVHHHDRVYDGMFSRAVLVLVWFSALGSVAWLRSHGALFQTGVATLGAGCLLGGAAGNLTDILHRRHVIDFIDLGWWPVFNLADVAIVGGLLLAGASVISHL